jgi:dCMP deaminase
MTKQQKLDKVFLNMAKEISSLSYCVRAKVGCVIEKNGNIISFGYNGTPSGTDNCCEEKLRLDPDAGGWLDPETVEAQYPFLDDIGNYRLISKPEVLHAESNAILKAAKSGISTDGATMYLTLSPCIDCTKLILQSGIKRVVYSQLFYRDNGSVDYLSQFIKVEKYDF